MDNDNDKQEDEQWRMMVITTFAAVVTASIVFIFLRMNRTSSEPKEPTVTELNVYPIKSCAPMNVQSAMVTEIGFLYDRFVQVSDSNGNYLTPRDKQNEKLFHIKPTIIVQDDNDQSSNNMHLELTCSTSSDSDSTSTSSTYRINNFNETIKNSSITKEVKPMIGPNVQLQDLGDEVASWLSNVTNIKDCRLTAIGSKYHRLVEINPDQGDIVPPSSLKMKVPAVVSLADEAPFLLASSSSLKDLNSRLKVRGKSIVDMQRFRPNIIISGKSLLPWEEDTWKRIKIGGVEFHVWQRCGRCTMTTIDRSTLQRGPEPLATLATFRERDNGMRNFGMHMIPIMNNTSSPMEHHAVTSLLEVGHTLEVLEYDEQRLNEWKRLFSS
jgi:uncharacterized protein YcbX